MPANSTPVQSVDRTLDIIEALSAAPGGLNLSELAPRVSLHPSTAHRLLAALAARGYAQKNPASGKYRLTLRLFEVGSRVANETGLLSLSRPCLESLRERTEETIHLVVRDDCETVYLYKEGAGGAEVRMGSSVGSRYPMYCTGVGKSILALLPEVEVERIWNAAPATRFTDHTIVTLDALRGELAHVRAAGYAVDREEHEQGVSCVAAAVRDFEGNPIAAVSVSVPAYRFNAQTEQTFAPLIVEAVEMISLQLGRAPV